jgi:hypothetical protein
MPPNLEFHASTFFLASEPAQEINTGKNPSPQSSKYIYDLHELGKDFKWEYPFDDSRTFKTTFALVEGHQAKPSAPSKNAKERSPGTS